MKHFLSQQDYLYQSGVLEHGSEEEIQKSKQAYRRAYKKHHKRLERTSKREFQPAFSQGEILLLRKDAKRHERSITRYIREAALAYATQSYLVPQEMRLREIESTLNQIFHFLKGNPESQAIISHLEHRFNDIMRSPKRCPGCTPSYAH